jgi:hypothetical protein
LTVLQCGGAGIGFGGKKEGSFALYVDKDLERGRSQSDATFDSPCLTAGGLPSGDFVIHTIECWEVAPPKEGGGGANAKGSSVLDRYDDNSY